MIEITITQIVTIRKYLFLIENTLMISGIKSSGTWRSSDTLIASASYNIVENKTVSESVASLLRLAKLNMGGHKDKVDYPWVIIIS